MTVPDRVDSLQRLLNNYRNAWAIPATTSSATLKELLTSKIKETMVLPLSDAERRDNAARALESFITSHLPPASRNFPPRLATWATSL